MSELEISAGLVGQRVRAANRPEWGDGTVVRVWSTTLNGQPRHRVSIQFTVGHKTLQIPPAQLVRPTADPERAAGWLDKLGKSTLDDRLKTLPAAVTDVLGSPRDKIAALLPLYAYTDEPSALDAWARRQMGVADALSQWNRDELQVAFAVFVAERDSHLRALVAELKEREGPQVVTEWLAALPAALRPAVHAALARII